MVMSQHEASYLSPSTVKSQNQVDCTLLESQPVI